MSATSQPRFREPLPGEFRFFWMCWGKGHPWLSPEPACPNKGQLIDTTTGQTVCGECAARILAQQAKPSWWRRITRRSK